MKTPLPILYSFRRCPYAMRARMALYYSGITVELREILLKDKPKEMLIASAKGTVPVLQLSDDQVIEESRELMMWALKKNDPNNWFYHQTFEQQLEINRLIDFNDYQFKPLLDRYKYASRYPEHTEQYYRKQSEFFLLLLENNLVGFDYLLGSEMTVADIAIFPFVRQFAFVNKNWFDNSGYTNVQRWLNELLNSVLFGQVMTKYSPWKPDSSRYIIF